MVENSSMLGSSGLNDTKTTKLVLHVTAFFSAEKGGTDYHVSNLAIYLNEGDKDVCIS